MKLLSGDSSIESMVGDIQLPLPDDAPVVTSSGHCMTARDRVMGFTIIVVL